MLHLYGTREDTKIWPKIVSTHAKKCSRIEVSVAEGRWDRPELRRAYKSSAQYPWVLRGSLEEKYANINM